MRVSFGWMRMWLVYCGWLSGWGLGTLRILFLVFLFELIGCYIKDSGLFLVNLELVIYL